MSTMPSEDRSDASDVAIRPIKLAHFVLRTSRFEEAKAWYKAVLGAHASFENDQAAFLTYDEEHHRIALVNVPGLDAPGARVAGLHHVAFTYASLGDLLATYERLKRRGTEPLLAINHGPTTSLYYADPDGNQLEFQIENFDTIEESTAFFLSESFRENPVGTNIDPDDLIRRMRSGEDEASLKKRIEQGPRGIDSVAL